MLALMLLCPGAPDTGFGPSTEPKGDALSRRSQVIYGWDIITGPTDFSCNQIHVCSPTAVCVELVSSFTVTVCFKLFAFPQTLLTRNMMGSRVFEVSFLALSALGFALLWPVMVYNGTLIALLRAAWNGAFADGRPLRTTYICFPPVDFAISVLVAFFDDQIDGNDDGTWLFMFDFQALLQTATLWVLIEASRKGQSERLLKL